MIIDHGKVIAAGTPAELIRQTGVKTTFILTIEGDSTAYVEKLRSLSGILNVNIVDDRMTVFSESESGQLVQVIQIAHETNVQIRAVEVMGPNLGAVFLHFTGRELRD